MNTKKPRILIIDDDTSVCSIMDEILREDEYELFFAVNGRDGLEKVRILHPDLIFLDMCMPVLDGVGFLRQLNALDISSCPVLVMTGCDDELIVDECFNEGIYSIIRKPFRSVEIRALCRRYTGISWVRKQLSFNRETLDFLSQQAHFFGLDNVNEQALIEALPLPVFVKNREQVLVQVNKAFEEFTGLDRREVLGRTCAEISNHQQFIARSHEIEQGLVENGGTAHNEQMVIDRNDQQREVVVYRSAVSNGVSGQLVGILGVMVDITGFGFSSYKKTLVGKYPTLTVRECEVANLVRLGMSTKEVARQLNIALCTVEYHRSNLREKLGLQKGDNTSLSSVLLAL